LRMMVQMNMRMDMRFVLVPMAVYVHEVVRLEQLGIFQYVICFA